ncbi:sugar 3,4-ketoisomerase [Limnoglobus roseus]|uniref:sugar 3,4-ketoisomerase n=1 Tax=Limnoglobus roseus TaxID=2598579 RepID=UPI0011EB93E3|nr:FdtA/QdtA family cupin domain-containing protein [Limnoglobus roseus]
MGPRSLELPRILDARGNLSFLQEGNQVPFAVRRVYWIYDVPGGEVRGSHAFRNTEEIVLALSGSFEVVLHDGEAERVYPLKRSYVGLYVPQMLWRTLRDFSTNSVALILASTPYDENDYVRDFDEFHQLRNGR